jgi:hypothetical protein
MLETLIPTITSAYVMHHVEVRMKLMLLAFTYKRARAVAQGQPAGASAEETAEQ